MEFLVAGYEIIEQKPGLKGVYEACELPGRICYGSQDKIEPGSSEPFVKRLIDSNHGAPLEHGTVYLHLNIPRETNVKWGKEDLYKIFLKSFFNNNPYSRVVEKDNDYYITTNLRVIFENKIEDKTILDIVKEHPEMFCETPTEYHEKRVSVRIICSRGVSHEAVRHRTMSFCQTSQRYVNYTLDKFGNEITFIIPE